jgi:hypothetical protein
MDRVLLQKKTQEHQDVTLRMDPFLFRRLGIVRNAVHLKIADYYLNCVPFDLSLKQCRAISVLGSREIETFSAYVGSMHNLNMTLEHPGFSKPISFFIRVRLRSFVQHNPDSNVCIISMDNVTVPNDFTEIFVGVADELAFCRALYDDDGKATESVGLESFRSAAGPPYFTLRGDGEHILKGKAVSVAPRQITLFCDTEGGVPVSGTSVEVEHPHTGALATGTLTNTRPSAEAPEYAFLTVDLRYSPAYIGHPEQRLRIYSIMS